MRTGIIGSIASFGQDTYDAWNSGQGICTTVDRTDSTRKKDLHQNSTSSDPAGYFITQPLSARTMRSIYDVDRLCTKE